METNLHFLIIYFSLYIQILLIYAAELHVGQVNQHHIQAM